MRLSLRSNARVSPPADPTPVSAFGDSSLSLKLIIAPVKKELGFAFKGSQKMVVEALEAMSETEAMEMKGALESNGEVEFNVCTESHKKHGINL